MRVPLNPRLDLSVRHAKGRRGFALIITLSLMVLLSMLAVGALVLSSSALRTAARGAAQGEAQANARMALALALGELQLQMGPDQRVSANADILAEAGVTNPHWTGVWDSWRAGEGEPSQHQTIRPDAAGANHQMSPTYSPNRQDYFRSWLVSLPPEELANVVAGRTLAINGSAAPAGDSVAVQLVGPGSLGADAGDGVVSAPLIAVVGDDEASQSRSRFGWWVGDESQKAHIMEDQFGAEESLSMAERMFRVQAPGSTGTTRIAGLEEVDPGEVGTPVSLASADLIPGAVGNPSENFHSLTTASYGIFADVREGGLKRDLNALLERPIRAAGGSPIETEDRHMLYSFQTKDAWMPSLQEAVPIQDLAAYYQLYDSTRFNDGSAAWRLGVQYASNLQNNGIQTVSPDFGHTNDFMTKYRSEVTTIYRQPVPVKVQFLLSMFAQAIDPPIQPTATDPLPNTHELLIGITPSMTLWNANNIPLTMRFDANRPGYVAQLLRLKQLPLHIRWIKEDQAGTPVVTSDKKNLFWYGTGADGFKPHLFNLYFSGVRPIRFEPGEVRVFSLPLSGDVSGVKSQQGYAGNWAGRNADFFFKTDEYFEGHEVAAGWEPSMFMLYRRSAQGPSPHIVNFKLRFRASDDIVFEATPDVPSAHLSDGNWFMFAMTQANHQSYNNRGRREGSGHWGNRHYHVSGRTGGNTATMNAFNQQTLSMGFPGGAQIITAAPRSGQNLINRSQSADGWPFLQVSFQAAVETSESANSAIAAGRRFASRPFLHSSVMGGTQMEANDRNSLYNYGWNWWIDEINDVFEAPVQVSAGNQGYHGGGFTPERGTTHVVQREIPTAPIISIAGLSHAHLTGLSIANGQVNFGGHNNGIPQAQWVTATGQAGLFPHTIQAVGNSYAHPNLAPDRAWTTIQRSFVDTVGRNVIFADHSYLANKALWDDFFFSSITPQNPGVRTIAPAPNRTARQVAEDFFFGEEPLPNRRMVPYTANLDSVALDELFTTAGQFTGGLADRIAEHLMMRGPFNINSTSAEAWRVVLSSLQGKPVAYRDPSSMMSGVEFDEAIPEGVPVSGFSLANGAPRTGSSSDPSEPEQWIGWRELTEEEIDELASAIVKQVKLRGPFLSLSEFVNRRLDPNNRELSAKGALQAAIDDPDVSINDGFRSPLRQFSSDEINSMNPAFPEALEGPVAYGSSAYVDQADILRNFAGQLTPRGDTFVIRTYGDSVDGGGNVVARAWCEAVVQRVPDYVDGTDEPHLRKTELDSEANKSFGRKFRIVSFRWLNSSEI